MKRVAEMALAEKQNEGLIFENRTGATVNDILPDDEANEKFDEINGNITGVEWEAETEIQEPAAHMPQLKKINMRHWQARRTMKATTTKVQEWTTTAKSQECDTTTKSQKWIATTRARNREAQEQLTKRTNWHALEVHHRSRTGYRGID